MTAAAASGEIPASGDTEGVTGGTGLRRVHIVGAGLIGTSIGLALSRRGIAVTLEDAVEGNLAIAVRLGAGTAESPAADTEVAVVCTPPSVSAQVIQRLLRLFPESSVSDVGSVKSNLIAEVETLGADLSRFVGGHPMAGRELSGPAAADVELFAGRPWVLTPTAATSAATVSRLRALAEACGAVVELRAPAAHDQAVAWVSHLPQLLSSLLAAGLHAAPAGSLRLAGPALRDMTRIAASDPQMWAEIAVANAAFLRQPLEDFAARIAPLQGALAEGNAAAIAAAVTALLAAGNEQVQRIPGKHGGPQRSYVRIAVTISDSPGQLAQLLDAAAAAGVNVEDLTVDHAPGAAAGSVDLYVSPAQAAAAEEALARGGWRVVRPVQ